MTQEERLWIAHWTIGALSSRYNVPKSKVEEIKEEARRDYVEWKKQCEEIAKSQTKLL